MARDRSSRAAGDWRALAGDPDGRVGGDRANKLRSLLTMLGVIIGVGAVITMVALGEGARKSVEARINALGTDVLTIMPGQRQRMGASREGEPLTVANAYAVLERSPNLIDMAPEMSQSVQVEYLNRNTQSQALGTTPSYLKVNRFELAAGRFISDEDMEARRRVAVLGAELLNSLAVSPAEILGAIDPAARAHVRSRRHPRPQGPAGLDESRRSGGDPALDRSVSAWRATIVCGR